MQAHPYLFFNGRCEEALAFYGKALDAEVVDLMRYSDAPADNGQCAIPPERLQKVMHASVRVGQTTLFASDGYHDGELDFRGFALTIAASGEPDARRMFDALAEGGQVATPLAKTFFASLFGMVTDRYGVMWMLMVRP